MKLVINSKLLITTQKTVHPDNLFSWNANHNSRLYYNISPCYNITALCLVVEQLCKWIQIAAFFTLLAEKISAFYNSTRKHINRRVLTCKHIPDSRLKLAFITFLYTHFNLFKKATQHSQYHKKYGIVDLTQMTFVQDC